MASKLEEALKRKKVMKSSKGKSFTLMIMRKEKPHISVEDPENDFYTKGVTHMTKKKDRKVRILDPHRSKKSELLSIDFNI